MTSPSSLTPAAILAKAPLKKETCSSCGAHHDREGQRYCAGCHAAYQREHRRKLTRERRAVARFVAQYARREGEIKPMPCMVCGRRDAEMHHPDHEMARFVIWLCRDHHLTWHDYWKEKVIEEFCKWLDFARDCDRVRQDCDGDVPFVRPRKFDAGLDDAEFSKCF